MATAIIIIMVGAIIYGFHHKLKSLIEAEKSRLIKKCVHKGYQAGYKTGCLMTESKMLQWSEEDEEKAEQVKDAIHQMYIGRPIHDELLAWFINKIDRGHNNGNNK